MKYIDRAVEKAVYSTVLLGEITVFSVIFFFILTAMFGWAV